MPESKSSVPLWCPFTLLLSKTYEKKSEAGIKKSRGIEQTAEAHIKGDNQTSGLLLLSALVFKTAKDFNHMPVVLLLIKIKAWQLTCTWNKWHPLALCFHWNRLVFALPWWSSPWKTESQMQTSETLLGKFIYSIGTHQPPVVICHWWKRHESTLGTWSSAQVEFKSLTRAWQAIKSLSQQQLVNVTFIGIFFGYNRVLQQEGWERKGTGKEGGSNNCKEMCLCSSPAVPQIPTVQKHQNNNNNNNPSTFSPR